MKLFDISVLTAITVCALAGEGGASDCGPHTCPIGTPMYNFDGPECTTFIISLGTPVNGESKYGPSTCDTCKHCDLTVLVTFESVECDPPLCLYYRNSQFPWRFGKDERLNNQGFGVFSFCDAVGQLRFWIAPCDGDAPAWADPASGEVAISCGCV